MNICTQSTKSTKIASVKKGSFLVLMRTSYKTQFGVYVITRMASFDRLLKIPRIGENFVQDTIWKVYVITQMASFNE